MVPAYGRGGDLVTATCILLDLYGTLVDVRLDEDSPPLWAGLSAAVAELRGLTTSPTELRERFRAILADEARRGGDGFIMEPVFRRVLSLPDSPDDARVADVGRVFRRLSLKELILRPYVVPLFTALRAARSQIAIVSNTEASLSNFDLDQFPVLRTADAIVLSSDVGIRKPEPGIFHLALNRLHAAATAAVFVGNDWDADVRGARAAGIRAVYLAGQMSRNDDEGIVCAAPTLTSIVAGLRACGWHG
jgi:putative hydrolase of the HAD superfamily